MIHPCRWLLIGEMVDWLHKNESGSCGPNGEDYEDGWADFDKVFAHATAHERRLAFEIQYFQGIASKHDPFAPLEPLKPGHMRMWSPRIEVSYFKIKH